jgi:phage repressor protein C with HTH and peptisase S24 domain
MRAIGPLTAPSDVVTPSALRRLAALRPLPIAVVGDSMRPTLCDGDIVGVAPERCYLPGDIIAFRQKRSGRMLVHRVLGYRRTESGWAVLAQGDACPCHDGATPVGQIIGRVRWRGRETDPLKVSITDRLGAFTRWCRLAAAWLARKCP